MFVRNFYETAETAKNIDFKYIENQIINPNQYSDKNEIPLIFAYNFNNNTANKDNAISISYLILDFEKSISISSFLEKYKEFKFYLYTSFSHKIKDTSDRFRVIIPLDRDYTIEEYSDYCVKLKMERGHCVLSKYFEGVDKSCFGIGFGQKAPGDNGFYEYHINEGKLFSFSDIPQKLVSRFKSAIAIDKSVAGMKAKKEYRSISTLTDANKIKYYKEKLERTIFQLEKENNFNWNKSGTGQGTDQWLFSAAIRLMKCKAEKTEIVNILLRMTKGKKKREIEHKVEDVFKKAME